MSKRIKPGDIEMSMYPAPKKIDYAELRKRSGSAITDKEKSEFEKNSSNMTDTARFANGPINKIKAAGKKVYQDATAPGAIGDWGRPTKAGKVIRDVAIAPVVAGGTVGKVAGEGLKSMYDKARKRLKR